MIFGIKFNPSILKNIVTFQNNDKVLQETFRFLGFTNDCSEIMSTSPSKFLWSGLLQFFKGKLTSTISDCVNLLSKMDVLSDPGTHMNDLLDLFA